MDKTDKPIRPCHNCGMSEWYLVYGNWICGICHPLPETKIEHYKLISEINNLTNK
jgi:hypothetical protein